MQVLAICRRLAITGVLIFVSTATGAIIPSSNQIDWTQSGIPGGVAGASGIPNRTAIYATIDASAYGNDQTDATAAIQSALNNCPANEVVYIPAGTYLIKGSISIPSNATLRGAGPTLTILDAQGSGFAVVTFGPGPTPVASSSVAITGGATQGSTSITVSSTSGISVGSLLLISELNDPTFVTINGTEGICTWCDGGLGWNGRRAAGQDRPGYFGIGNHRGET